MKKVLKIFILIAILFAFTVNVSVFAAPTDDQNQQTENPAATVADSSSNTSVTQNNQENKSSTQVTTVSAVDEGKLSISDILNILLIATGIVIILLAIAIFIKVK